MNKRALSASHWDTLISKRHEAGCGLCAAEVEHLAEVLESARLIAVLLATGGLPDDDAVRHAPRLLRFTCPCSMLLRYRGDT